MSNANSAHPSFAVAFDRTITTILTSHAYKATSRAYRAAYRNLSYEYVLGHRLRNDARVHYQDAEIAYGETFRANKVVYENASSDDAKTKAVNLTCMVYVAMCAAGQRYNILSETVMLLESE